MIRVTITKKQKKMKKLIFVLLLVAFLVLMAIEFESTAYTLFQCVTMILLIIGMFKTQINE